MTVKQQVTATSARKKGSGGKRAGAGRPFGSKQSGRTLSEEAVARSLEVSARYAKEFKKTTDELMHDVAYGRDWAENAAVLTRMKAIEKIHERQAPRIQEGGPTDTGGRPPAELPARKPDPALH
jgi:hypothetical protein